MGKSESFPTTRETSANKKARSADPRQESKGCATIRPMSDREKSSNRKSGSHTQGNLVKDTEWMRVYQTGPKSYHYESKFLTDGLQVSAQSLVTRWPSMTANERLDFVQAYSAKREFTSEDEAITSLIMSDGDDYLWSALAKFMLRHPHRDKILGFLRERVQNYRENPANYIQALGLAKDLDAVPLLTSYLTEYRRVAEGVTEHESAPFEEVVPIAKYIWCCQALWLITGSQDYESEIRKYTVHPHNNVRTWAKYALAVSEWSR
jgi:hypothetical protein